MTRSTRVPRKRASIGEITDETIQWFLDDMARCGRAGADRHAPRDRLLPQMVAMIEQLIATVHAYEAEGHVLFRGDANTRTTAHCRVALWMI